MGGGYCEIGRGGVPARRIRVGESRLKRRRLELVRGSVNRVPLVSASVHVV